MEFLSIKTVTCQSCGQEYQTICPLLDRRCAVCLERLLPNWLNFPTWSIAISVAIALFYVAFEIVPSTLNGNYTLIEGAMGIIVAPSALYLCCTVFALIARLLSFFNIIVRSVISFIGMLIAFAAFASLTQVPILGTTIAMAIVLANYILIYIHVKLLFHDLYGRGFFRWLFKK